MAYREFHQEASYKDPNIRFPFEFVQAVNSAVNFNRQRKMYDLQQDAARKKASREWDPDREVASYEVDEKNLFGKFQEYSKMAREQVAETGDISPDLKSAYKDLDHQAQLTQMQKKFEEDSVKQIQQSKDPYMDKDLATRDIIDVSRSHQSNPKNRTQRQEEKVNQIYNSTEYFKDTQYLKDYTKDMQKQTIDMTNEYEDLYGVTVTRSSTIKAPFMRETGRMIDTPNGPVPEYEPGVTNDHVVDYLDSDPRVEKKYEREAEERMMASIRAKRAAGEIEPEFQDLTDEEYMRMLKLSDEVGFEYQKRLAAKQDLERMNNMDITLSKKINREAGGAAKQLEQQQKQERVRTHLSIASKALTGDRDAMNMIASNHKDIRSIEQLEDGSLEVNFKDDEVKTIGQHDIAGMLMLIPGHLKDISEYVGANDTSLDVIKRSIGGDPKAVDRISPPQSDSPITPEAQEKQPIEGKGLNPTGKRGGVLGVDQAKIDQNNSPEVKIQKTRNAIADQAFSGDSEAINSIQDSNENIELIRNDPNGDLTFYFKDGSQQTIKKGDNDSLVKLMGNRKPTSSSNSNYTTGGAY